MEDILNAMNAVNRLKSAAEASLSVEDRKKAVKIRKLLEKLDSGNDVQNRDLQSVLTEAQFREMQDEWESVKGKVAPDKPSAIVEYEEKLKKALFIYAKGDSYSVRGNHDQAKKFIYEAESLFEQLLVNQREIIYTDASAVQWFDRVEGGLDPSSIPRIVTSRSLHNQRRESSRRVKYRKKDVKQNALHGALNELGLF